MTNIVYTFFGQTALLAGVGLLVYVCAWFVQSPEPPRRGR